MAETLTSNYDWTKPDPGFSANTWGVTINSDLDKIDNQVFINSQRGVEIGTVVMYAGATAPTNWLICDGSILSTAAPYDKLFAAIGNAFNPPGTAAGSFALPNLANRMPLGAGRDILGTQGGGSPTGTFQYTITMANLPAHAHPITDLQHNHTLGQTPHGHSDSGHGHGITISQDPHSHGLDRLPLTSSSGTQGAAGPGWGFNATVTDTQQPAVHATIALGGANITSSNANLNLFAASTGINTTQAVGSGTPMNIVPPYSTLNFIIKFA